MYYNVHVVGKVKRNTIKKAAPVGRLYVSTENRAIREQVLCYT